MERHSIARFALALALLGGCGDDTRVAPPTEAQCDADPLLPGCTPDERPTFAGLDDEVAILRDDMGVAHVYAQSDRDAFYASGYMQAFDRLLQMDLNRRRALGRRAEVLGESYVDEDELSRLFDLPRWARTNEAALFRDDPERWALVQAWTEGVNARIREVLADRSQLPPEFEELGYEPEEWTPVDAFAFGKLVLFGNANQLESSILSAILDEYLPELDGRLGLLLPIRDAYVMPPDERPATARAIVRPSAPRTPRALPPDALERIARFQSTMADFRSGGSNNWALDGRHTANGRPLIAGDPHQPLQSPSLFWLHHMNSADAGGALDVVGFNFVGSPGVQLGHNRHVAWTATTTYPDNMDVWDVAIGPGGGVMIGDEEVAIVTRTETIAVAGANTVEYVVEDVPGHGVLLPSGLSPLPLGRPGRRLLVNWTGLRVTHEFEGFFGFGTARDTDEFAAAVEGVELGYFNFVFADANGIRYHSQPLVPDRGVIGARRPWALSDGDDASTFWRDRWLDRARMPSSTGGARGWITSANNDPFGFVADGRVDTDPWYFGVLYDPGLRAARIEQELERLIARGDVTVEDMQVLQDDTHSIIADDLVPVLEEVWATVETDDALAEWRGRDDLDALVVSLAAWDRRMERTSSEAVVLNAFSYFLAQRVLADDMTIVFDAVMSESSAFIFKWLSNVLRGRAPDSESFFAGEARSVSVVRALDETAAWLAERFPGGSYTWGDVHGTRFPSLYGERLDGGWVATDGAEGTVNVSVTDFFGDGDAPRERLEASSGSIYRLVATFGDDGTPEAFVNVPRGVSGDPESAHWSDLHTDWIENVYRPLRFRRSDIEAGEHERMTLSPQ
ncbi:penicillin acylase family protein [Sandaracinus amylolyticus]|uniref:Penicillin G acylase n=1 Tax=Sandaracinus amylolyticus TaxID=927083 RepID=A0A0F6VZC0_9BACT|nr:penicillin acylase family protein [Sandaracinus amylolyticus]AKF03467.1 Penicillin G acylase precursor [Sandaracinus amylolyticus]